MNYAPSTMSQEKPRSSSSRKGVGGRPKNPPAETPVAHFLAEMDVEVRAFFDHLRARARATEGKAPPAKQLVREALREWSESHPEWPAFVATHGQ